MYHLLIADDEESIREGVADFVRKNCPAWEVVALACDGKEALELVRKTLPDAILTDITMPHMNGLDFLENVRNILPEAKLLVLSGYDQFEYAVQALRLGVEDYLLKPLDTSKLIDALDVIASKLEEDKLRWMQIEQLCEDTKKTNEMELQRYFHAALSGGTLPELSAENASFVQSESTYYCVLCDGPKENEKSLESLLQQRLYGTARIVSLRVGTPGQQVFVVCAQCKESAGFFLRLNHVLTAIAVLYKRMMKCNVHFFIGCIAEQPEKLALSYHQCRRASLYTFPEQAAPVTTYEDVLASKLLPCPVLKENLVRDIVVAAQCENRGEFMRMCDELFSWFVQEEIRDAKFIRMCVLSLCYGIMQKPARETQISYYEFTNFQEEIMAAGSMEELRACFENFVALYWLRKQEEKKPAKTLTKRVNQVVQEHIADVDFSLDDVAAELFISPNYLRQLFKQETGQTFTEFLTAQRMQLAHVLLGNPQSKVCDVAQQVGYADSRYFSVCFKKFYHETPSEYQMELNDERN